MNLRWMGMCAISVLLPLAVRATIQPRPALPPPGGAFSGTPPSAAASAAQVQAGPSGQIQDLVGDKLVNAKGDDVPVSALGGKKVIGLYFSASWCGPCHAFTPVLVKAYNEARQVGLPVEIILVSSDESAGAMKKYMREMDMPWLAIPFASSKREQLSAKYQVRGIPTLIIVDANGVTLETNGRGAVSAQGAKALEAWAK